MHRTLRSGPARRRRSPRLSVHTLEARDVPAAFTAGDLIIYRVGDGSATLTGNGSAVFLDEYTPAGTLVQSIALPTTDPDGAGPQHQLIAGGTATAEGLMTRSGDGSYLAFAGYARDLGGTTALSGTTPTAVPRVIALVGADGTVDTTTTVADSTVTGSPRGVATQDGTSVWLSTQSDGIRAATRGGSTSTQLNGTITTMRYVNVYGGQLYTSANTGSFRVGTVGTGLPTTSGQTITNLPGYPTTGSPYGFFFADLDPGVAGNDTLYVADDAAGVQKYSLVGGNWTANGSAGVGSDAYRGLTGVVSGSTVTLYLTRKGGEFVSLTDSTGYNATIPTTFSGVLAAAGSNKAFRGIALAPEHANTAPTNTLPPTFTTAEDNSKVLSGLSVADDSGSLPIKVTLSVPTGTLTVSTSVANGLSAAQVSGNGTGAVVLTAPLAAINATLADAAGLTFAPTADAFGDVTLTMVTDDQGNFHNIGSAASLTDTDTATITVTPVADDPTVTDASTNEDVQTTGGLVFTRNAADGDEITHVKVTGITNGTLYLSNGTTPVGNGDFVPYAEAHAGLKFTPSSEFSGAGSFQVQASTSASDAGLGGAVRTATVTVAAVNDAPVNTLPAAGFTTDEDNSVPLTGISVADVDAGTADVTVTLTIPGGAGSLRVATGVAGGVTAGQVTANNSTAVTVTAPVAAINATLADAAGLIYFPAAEQNGSFDLSMVTNDLGNTGGGGALTDEDHRAIAVAAVNDAPVAVVPGDQFTPEDTPVVFSPTNANPITVADVDSGAGLKLTLTATNGTVMLGGTTGLTDITGWGTAVLSATGTPADLTAALVGATFTPDTEFSGAALLRVAVDDQGNTGSGGPQSTFMNVSIGVTAVNDPPDNVGPIAPFNTAPVTEDTPFAFVEDFSFRVSDPDAGTGDLSTTMTATHGTISVADVPNVTITGNGSTVITVTGPLDDLNAALAGLTYTPDHDYFGPAAIDVVTDDQGNTGGPAQTDTDTFPISVAAVNDAPVLGDYEFFLNGAVAVGTPVGTVTATDVENDQVTYAITAGDPGGNFAIDPATGAITIANPAGLATDTTLTVTATDNGSPNLGDTGTVLVHKNSAPTGAITPQGENEDGPAVTLHLTDYFADAEQSAATLTYALTGNTNAGLFQSVALTGTDLVLTPKADANGFADVTVKATDNGGLFTSATFRFTLDPVNDAPTLDPLSNLNVDEDATEVTVDLGGLSAGPADEAGQTLTVTATSGDHTLFADPTVSVTGTTGTLKFTPLPNANGFADVAVTVTDDGGTANGGVNTLTRTFRVTVWAVADAPVLDTSFTPMLPPIKIPIPKNTFPAGAPIGTLVAHVADADGGDPKGVAITAADTTGTWQFTTNNGASWTAFPAVSEATPLRLIDDGQTQVRFIPNKRAPGVKAFTKGFAGLTYRAWDGSNESAQTEQAWVAVGKTVPAVDADGHPLLKAIREDVRQSGAYTVKTILGILAKETDPTKVFGIALSGTTGTGAWEFNTGKSGWLPVGSVTDAAALLLRPTDRVRFKPGKDFDGDARLTYHTWDMTTGTFGTTADATGTGFSAATETAILDVKPVNDVPVVTGHPALGTLGAGQTTTEQTVAAFLAGVAVDVDSPALGIQLLPASTKVGAWQVKDSLGNWVDVKRATLLRPDAEVRFRAAATAKAGTYNLSFKVWDQFTSRGTLSKTGTATLTIA